MSFENRYGFLDRVLHRLAFRVGFAQEALADVEELVHAGALRSVEHERPVLISGLPRSGTTILLNLFWASGRFASHTYRDMPFALCPLLWNRFSSLVATEDEPRERAHGDGLQISSSSPEAFEEMVWKRFWKRQYRDDRILPWTEADVDEEFDRFLERNIRKVILLRSSDSPDRRRYVSKNNLNIARLAAPPGPFQDGVFLIPFRDPVQQAASMLAQHRRFLRIHDEQPFVLEYMNAIGHHEFGRGLRPIDFGNWMASAPDTDELEFWILYWIASYQHVLRHVGPRVTLVSYRGLTEDPVTMLGKLAEIVDVPPDDLTTRADQVRPPREHPVDLTSLDGDVLNESYELQDRLERAAPG